MRFSQSDDWVEFCLELEINEARNATEMRISCQLNTNVTEKRHKWNWLVGKL